MTHRKTNRDFGSQMAPRVTDPASIVVLVLRTRTSPGPLVVCGLGPDDQASNGELGDTFSVAASEGRGLGLKAASESGRRAKKSEVARPFGSAPRHQPRQRRPSGSVPRSLTTTQRPTGAGGGSGGRWSMMSMSGSLASAATSAPACGRIGRSFAECPGPGVRAQPPLRVNAFQEAHAK
jgi:hypothetical protein